MNPLLWLKTLILIIFIALLKVLYLKIKELRRTAYLMDKLPGPKAYPIVGSALSFSPDNETCTYQMEKVFRIWTEMGINRQCGLMRLWIGPKPILIVYRPETVKAILESPSLISKPIEYDGLKDWLGTGLLTSTDEKWHNRRKMLTPAFHFSILLNFLKIFNKQTDTFLYEMDKEADKGYPFDFYKYIKALTLDIIGETAMGIELGCQQGKNKEYSESVKKQSELIWLRMRSPWFWPKILWYSIGYGNEANKHLKIIKGTTEKIIKERKNEREKIKNDDTSSESSKLSQQDLWEIENFGTRFRKQAFLDILLNMQDDNKLSDNDIREEVDTFMFEGHDTVSSTMAFTVYLIAHYPDIQEKIYEEIRGILDNSDQDVTHDDLSRMKYLEQCIRETLRLFPTVPMIGRIINEDVVINGYTIPKGITAMITPFAVHRDKRYYHNPDKYDPEHFSFENISKRNPFAYIPFSAGPRNCIGQKFATIEQKVILSRFFLRYKVTPAIHELENRGLPELILKPNKGIPIRIERRIEY